ncbi:hypothetical protein SORBI_3004G190300 [Sorghum bicolor]|uniref:Granulins domain-containing protein n=1 Tax=Sorghum bicolor TaxID=4558 RepID=A0A1Z5RP17_SORBI|nr:hypothetical protein SORBI_3004G190300 [Sorghum bicolor]
MCCKIVAALAMALLLVLGTAEAQVLPTPCCRFDCCDGIRCCVAGTTWNTLAPSPSPSPSPSPAVAFARSDAKARPGGASRKIAPGN